MSNYLARSAVVAPPLLHVPGRKLRLGPSSLAEAKSPHPTTQPLKLKRSNNNNNNNHEEEN
jgi:hypothetical protein